MIRVAAGEKLALKQNDVKLNGWAVESRVYAEDPYRNFLPSTGRLTRYRPPQEGTNDGITVRNDTGVYEGGEISLYYDPMIAKLVTHAPTRSAAIAAQSDALDAFVVDGIRHNIPFLAALMTHPRWQAGKLSTGFIAEEFPSGFHAHAPEGETAQALAAVAAAIDHVLGERKRRVSGQLSGRSVTRESQRAVWLGEQEIKLEVNRTNGTIEVRMHASKSGPLKIHSGWKSGDPIWNGTINGKPATVQVRTILNGFALSYRGVETKAYVYTEREAGYARLMPVKQVADTGKQVLCPMPGLVVSIAVKEGQEVKAGETVAVVEAMKMENVLRAEIDGTVKKINAKPGDSLAVDAVILEFA
jgi:propionyl-CoA carboxylase alpha subunit